MMQVGLVETNKTINIKHSVGELGKANKTIDIEHNASGVNNKLDTNGANNTQKEAKVYESNLF